LLIASHIVPWRDSNDEEKLDVNNGILLSPNYDALFDKHLISFMDSGDILLSDKLTDAQRMSLKLNPSASIIVTEEMIPYLILHRQELR
jgi:predicted restriction endonuclease